MNCKARRGFTLLEVLLVILILGMLAGVLIVAVGGAGEGARRDTTTLLITTTVPNAIERYKFNIGHVPSEEEGGLKALRICPTFQDENLTKKWAGPYLTQEPKDGWGKDLHYEVSTGATTPGAPEYKLWSDGKDGQSGNEDDIKNWSDETGT